MSHSLKNRSLFSFDELSARDIHSLLEMARELKRARNAGTEQAQLRDKHLALMFDKGATRTPCAFEAAAGDQGANVSVINPGALQREDKAGVMDTARVLGRLYDAIEYRGLDPGIVNDLAAFAGVPVWNGLTNPHHPAQILADYMTMQEHCPGRPLAQLHLAYLGDARRRIGESLLQGAALTGMDFRVGAPPSLWPPQALIEASQEKARGSGATLRFVASAEEAVQDVDFICTDAWFSLQQPEAVWAERIGQLKPYQVTAGLMASSGNPAVKFLHGLPSPQEREARKAGEAWRRFGVEALEVTDDVYASPASLVADQAENRLHAIKAVLVATLA